MKRGSEMGNQKKDAGNLCRGKTIKRGAIYALVGGGMSFQKR